MNKRNLRLTALTEGVSWLLLLFVAMPIKYIGGEPLAVSYIGMAHGILFIVLVGMIVSAVDRKIIAARTGWYLFIASLLPFGTFVTDHRLREA